MATKELSGLTTSAEPIPVERVERSRVGDQDLSQLGFGRVFSDHMFVADYADGRWSSGRIVPYGPLPLPPSISGPPVRARRVRGHEGPSGAGRLSPALPAARQRARYQRSAARLAMPPVPEPLFLDGLRRLLREDREWARPTARARSTSGRAVLERPGDRRAARRASSSFSIFTSPYAKYFASAVDVLVSDRYASAFPGGDRAT